MDKNTVIGVDMTVEQLEAIRSLVAHHTYEEEKLFEAGYGLRSGVQWWHDLYDLLVRNTPDVL